MIPSIFMQLQQFPLTPNGKIDREALPKPEMASQESDYLAPDGDIERGLAEIWAQLLKINLKSISASANFFELGGHSLLAVKLLTKIRNTFEVNLKIDSLFESKTLSMLAAHLDMLTTKNDNNNPQLEPQEMEHFEI